MNVSMLAPFWDDADLTLGQGRLLYQVRHQYIYVSYQSVKLSVLL